MSPLFALMLGLPARCIPVLLLSLLLGTPVLSLLGAVGAALTVGLKRGGLLLALLILPLYIPVLILGSGALQASLQGLPAADIYLAGEPDGAIDLTPFAIAAGLKISVGEWSPPAEGIGGRRYRAAVPPTLDLGWQRKVCPVFPKSPVNRA